MSGTNGQEAEEKSPGSCSKSGHECCSCGEEIPFDVFKNLRQDVSAVTVCPKCGTFLKWNEKEESIVEAEV